MRSGSLRRTARLQAKCCGKRAYATEEAATWALERIQAFSDRATVPQRVYQCTYGGWWHITSQSTWTPKAPKDTGPHRSVREQVLERDDWTCFRRGEPIFGKPYSLQHRRGRGNGGSSDPQINRPSNLIAVCGTGTTGCHGWITAHPEEAEAAGWAVSLNSKHDPARIPVRHWRLGLLYLDDEFGYVLPSDLGGAA